MLDDDANFRALVIPALQAVGATVVQSAKGRDAMAELPKKDFAVLIVDGLLPDTSGIKWISAVRERGIDVPIIFISAFYRDLASYKRLTQELGVAEVIHKPLEPEALAKAVGRFIAPQDEDRRRRRRTSTMDLDRESLPDMDESGEHALTNDVFFVASDDDEDDTEALRRSYRDVLPHILELFIISLRLFRDVPKDPVRRDEALRQAHDLAGTAGSYGFDELGRAAAMIERELRRAAKGLAPDWAAFDGAIASIRKLPEASDIPSEPPHAKSEATKSEPPEPEPLESEPKPVPAEPAVPAEPPKPEPPKRPEPPKKTAAVDVPLRPETDPRPRRRRRSLPSSAMTPLASRMLGPRILVVDDDEALVEYIEHALEQTLVVLSTATTREEVRKEADHLDAAIVGVPFGSPDRSGAVVELLKKGRRALPVALLGLDDSWDARQRAVASGADLFLAHPIDDADLRRALRRLESLEASRGRILVHGASACAADLGQAGMWVRDLADVDSLIDAVRRDQPDVVVVGGPNASDVASAVRMTEAGADLAILAVNTRPEVVEAGADALLEQRSLWVTSVRAHARRAAARRRQGSDQRTGLPHRAEMVRRLSTRMAEAHRHGRAFTLVTLEVDDWDGLVHDEGTPFAERVVDGIARLLAGRFRVEDIRGAWTKGLLVCGFVDTEPARIAPAIRRVQHEIASLSFTGRSGRVSVTASAGIASAPETADDLRGLVLVSEGRLSLAKKSGRGGLVWTG